MLSPSLSNSACSSFFLFVSKSTARPTRAYPSFLFTDFNPIAVIVFVNVLLFLSRFLLLLLLSWENCFYYSFSFFFCCLYPSMLSVPYVYKGEKKLFDKALVQLRWLMCHKMKSPLRPRQFNLSLTLILKLLMTLLWTHKTRAAWQNWGMSFGTDRKATECLCKALCLFTVNTFSVFSPKTKHLSMNLSRPLPVLSRPHPKRSFLSQWVG